MHANQNLWGTEHTKVLFTYGIPDPEVGVCAKQGGRPQKTLACRPSDVLAGCSPFADDATVRFQPLHANVRNGSKVAARQLMAGMGGLQTLHVSGGQTDIQGCNVLRRE